MYLTRTNKPIARYITSLRPLALLTLLAICGGGSSDAGAATRTLAVESGTQQDVTHQATVSTTGAVVSGSRRHHHPPSLVSIHVTPANSIIALGTTQALTATGTYSDGSLHNLTTQVAWASNNRAVATVSNAAASQGRATSVGIGTAKITAVLRSIASTPVPLTVTAATLVSIAVTPAHPSIAIGSTQQFAAAGTYTDGSIRIVSSNVTWVSQTQSVATISNAPPTQGLASAISVGSSTITATLTGVSGSTVLTVRQASASIALGVFPGNGSGNPLWDLNRTALTMDETEANRKMDFVETFADWQDGGGYYATFGSIEPGLNAYASAGYDMVLTWSALNLSNASDSSYALSAIISGSHDDYITKFAHDAAVWGQRIYLRPFHEMNGNWDQWGFGYPWGSGVVSNTPALFQQAWIHVYTIFQQQNAKNVKFIWCPNVDGPSWQTTPRTSLADYYPGDAYVDWMALDGYNSFGAPWWQFSYIFSSSYAELVAINASKPIMVAETASEYSPPDGDKSAWIKSMETDIPTMFPNIRALSWFDDNGYAAPGYPPNLYRFDSDLASQTAFQNLAADPLWQRGRLGAW